MIAVDTSKIDEKVVLVVDDIFENLLILKRMLEKEGYKPLTASSAKDALEMVKVKVPQLILLDVYMPEMDGHEVIKTLKADAEYVDIPVVFLTSDAEENTEIQGFSEGAIDFLRKPFGKGLA